MESKQNDGSADPLERAYRRFWVERALYAVIILLLVLSHFVSVEEVPDTSSRGPAATGEGARNSVAAYAVVAEGRTLVALPTEAAARSALDTLKASYASNMPGLLEEPTTKESVAVQRRMVPAALVARTPADAAAILSGSRGGAGLHKVAEGENGWGIAKQAGITVEELAALNPGHNLDRLQVGEVLRTRKDAVLLTVVTKEKRKRQVVVPAPVQMRPSPRMYKGKQLVLQPGRPGLKEVTYVRVCENGIPVRTEQEQTVLLRRPRARVVVIGTLPRPRRSASR